MKKLPTDALQRRHRRQVPSAIVWLCATLHFLAGYLLFAQQTQPTSYVGFDGQTVSTVEISARPDVDLAAMRERIELQPGKPFSARELTASVAALQQTRLFSEVQVSLEPEQAGLRVLFILQPTDYVGMIDFRGTGTNFPYTALLQAVDIPGQSAYFPGLGAKGQQGLLDYLHKEGYFSAVVQVETTRDEAHRIVNVIFDCDLKKQARIRKIEFAGISEQQSEQLRAALRGIWAKLKRVTLKPGQRYSEPRIAKSINFIRDRLRTQNRLAPSVHLASSTYDSDSNRVDLRLDVVPGPEVSVRVTGARVSSKTLRRLIPIYEEGAADEDLIDEGQRNLRAYFQTKGYFDAKVEAHKNKTSEKLEVVYEVERGQKHREAGVNFDGNRYFSDGQLKSHVYIKKGFLFLHGNYSEQLLSKSVNSLAQLYKDRGFEDVSIRPKVEDFEPQVYVTFEISEGPQDKVGALNLFGNKTESLSALARKYPMQLRPGRPFSRKLMEADRTRLLAAYLDLGYLNATVRSAASVVPGQPHTVDVTYTIEEGPQAHISDVLFLGAHHTRASFIKGITSAQLKPGQPLSEGHFLQSESDLYDLGVFDWASVEPLRPVVDQTQEEVLVKIHESPLNSMDIGGGIEIIPRSGNIPVNSVAVPGIPPISLGNKFTVSQKSYVGPRFSFDFARHNLRGKAETATIGTVLSRLDQRGFFNYADPHLHGSSWSSLFSISGERSTQNPIYTAELGQASFQVERALDKKRTKNAILRYSFDRTNLYNILIPGLVLPQDRHVRLSTFDGEYIVDTRDKPLDAHHGVYQTFDFGVTSKSLGASADFVRFLGQSAFYVPVKPSLVWATNIRLGLAAPFSGSDVPLSERFFTGGADSLRGFPINGAGPQRPVPVCSNPSNPATCTLISVPVGGNMLFIINTEARFPLPIKQGLGGVFFYDGGNVYSNISLSQFVNDFTHSVGVGLRYQTPVGPVRFDFGYRITSVPGIKATQYFVTLGQSF
ncbi:MAG TPA: POTRA domain-containing protein [Candidatus Acidoferrales bacterium]